MPRICSDQAELAIQEKCKPSTELRQGVDAIPMTSPTILIIDDDSDVRKRLSDLLTQGGYRVTAVGHGAEAIEQVKQKRYGAALLDIQLVNPDGLSVMKAMRELDPKLPIIVLTGNSTVENNIGALLRDAFTCLAKPYDADDLTATLRRAVEVNHLATRAAYVERELSESKEQFRAVVESAPDAIVLADHRGLIISWNRAAQTLFVYAEEEVLDQPLTLIMPARYREAHQKGMERLRATGEARIIGKTMELYGLRKDGSEFPLELSLGTWKAATGIFYSGIIRDITERKRAQEALRESQERFNQLAENIRQVFWMTDPEKNRMVYVSPGYGDIWGRTCESLYVSPRSWLEAIHPDDRDRILQAALTKQVTGAYDEEYRIVRPDGSIRWIWDRAFPIRDASGHVDRITGIAEDITDRKRVEQELRASEERLELAVKGSSDGLWDGRPLAGEPWSSPHTPVWYSPRFKAMLGFEEQEFENVLGSLIMLLHPDDIQRVFAALSAHIECKEPYDVEYRLRTKQGEYRWFRSRAQAIWDEAGNLLRMAGSLQCITDRKRAEQRLHTQYATTRALEESATLLEATPKILQAACESLGWDFGALWDMDREANVLRCVASWYGASAECAEFASVSRDLTLSPGTGLPGRVWLTGKPAWIMNVHADTNFLRAPIALKAGLQGAMGFPIVLRNQILGVIEFLSREARQPDEAQIEMIAAIGSQIGQFVERRRDAERLARINECLLSFGKDANENINHLTGLCGELLGGACALYSYLDGELLHSIGQWRTPPGFNPVDKPNGHICCDVIKQGGNIPLLVRHLQETPYALTDP
ncbi:MAG TPA: PAS domain S-box protein, partial [Nitrospiraceae bacterium]|nr:PAS domain S-box protein [Nitrospiraceae bacterium]